MTFSAKINLCWGALIAALLLTLVMAAAGHK
jgi:hypothetical protein